MQDAPTAPPCVTLGCDNVSALTDVATGRFWRIEAYYCSDCYMALIKGELREIDASHLVVKPAGAPTDDPD